MLTSGAHEEQHRIDDSRNRVKHHGREDEGRHRTSRGEKDRDAAIKEERNGVGEEKREGWREHGERAITSAQEKVSTPISKRKERSRGERRALTMRESREMVKGV